MPSQSVSEWLGWKKTRVVCTPNCLHLLNNVFYSPLLRIRLQRIPLKPSCIHLLVIITLHNGEENVQSSLSWRWKNRCHGILHPYRFSLSILPAVMPNKISIIAYFRLHIVAYWRIRIIHYIVSCRPGTEKKNSHARTAFITQPGRDEK